MSVQPGNMDFSGSGRVPIHARSFLPWLIMLIGLLVTFGIWHLSNGDITSSTQERFDARAAQVVTAVEQRMHAYEQVLRGGVGLFLTAPKITRPQWHEYVENANMSKNYPGIQNMAVDFPIAAVGKSLHIATIRAEGHKDYNILPEQPDRPVYHSLVYVEPFGGRNLRAFGFDMYTSDVRRKAMDRAIDSGLPSMSGAVKLAQETNENVQHGFIYCLPVYYADRPTNTPEQRRTALRALVCGAFRANDLMRGIFGNSNSDLELEIFDEAITPTSLLYDSRHGDTSTISELSRTTAAEIGGRRWQLRISANQAYLDSVSFTQSRLIAVAGVTLSLLLFFGVGFGIRRRDLEVMHKNAELFQAMQDSVKESLLVLDKEGVILSANPTAVERFALTADQIVGRNIFDLTSSETSVPWRSSVSDVVRSGLPSTLVGARDGRHYLTYLYPVLSRHKKCEALVVFGADITERTRAEDDLEKYRSHLEEMVLARTSELAQAKDAAEAASSAKSVFLANMSHELRTPMHGVLGMIDMALRHASEPRQINWLNKGKGAAKHLLAGINDILDISQIESNRLTLEEKNFSLAQAIDEALQMQDTLAHAKGLSLSKEMDTALPDLLCGDAMRLKQILVNFTGNAIKFSERGQIIVRAKVMEEHRLSVLLRIEVADQGIGISPEQQARLFMAFTQVDGSVTRKYGGTGLGLVISRRIAQLMGGDAGVISEAGHGSTFWATVRVRKGVEVIAAPAPDDVNTEAL